MGSRLSATDATWANQDSTSPYSLSLIILEPSDRLSHEKLQQLVGSSLPQLARFRSRLVGKPLGVGQPLWSEIDDYDPTPQIHRATVRAPGGRRELADLIAQLSAGPYDRKTLWEAWSIDGLAGGRWALAVRISPALNEDGVGVASAWSRLLRSDPHNDGDDNKPAQTSLGTPSLGELMTDVITELLEIQVNGLWLIAETVAGALRTVRDQLRGTSGPDPMPPAGSSMSGPLPRNVFNAPLTERRTVAFASIPLAALETVSNAFGGNITNVFLAACTLSLRAWLLRRDSVPDDPLLMRTPLALPGAANTSFGVPLAFGRIRIPVQLDDPIEVLTNLHTATERMNTAHESDAEKEGSSIDLARVASLIPSTVVDTGMRLYTRLGLRQRLAPICHGSVSYVSGQPVPAYCAGAKVVAMHSVAPLLNGCGLSITLTSHGDVMDLSVCVCPDNVPAVDDIATGIADSLDILVTAARKSPRGQGRSVVTEMTSHATQRRGGRGY